MRGGGHIAKVIPVTACTAKNAQQQRQYIAKHFHIEIVVTLHDPKKFNFSENTGIHESLLVARRRFAAEADKPTRFISLFKYPENIAHADKIIAAIENNEVGEHYNQILWTADKVKSGDWSPVQWCNGRLAVIADKLAGLKRCIIASQYEWKPDARPLSDCYKVQDRENDDLVPLFASINQDVMNTLASRARKVGLLREGMARRADDLRKKGDYILVSVRFRTTSTRLFAVYSDDKSVGTAYRCMGVGDKRIAKVYVVFLNSIFGVLQFLNRRAKTLSYPKYEIGQMKTLMLPDIEQIDIDSIIHVFDEYRNMELGRLVDYEKDKVRKALDYVIADNLGFPKKEIDEWRHLLVKEPTVNNQYFTDS